MTPNFGAEVDVWKRTIGGELNMVVSKGPERGDKVSGVVAKLGVAGNGA